MAYIYKKKSTHIQSRSHETAYLTTMVVVAPSASRLEG